MPSKYFIALFITGLLSTAAVAQNVNISRIDSFFNALATNNKTMGSFAISKNGHIVYARSIGYSFIDSTHKVKADKNTLYKVGSISKLFTATMIYQLIDEGKLSLTTTLDKYYPEIPNAKDITIANLLEHRSGLYDFSNDEADETWVIKPHTRKEILNKIINGKTHFLPGTQSLYNNSGYLLLAYILEKITGHTYNQDLQSRICSKIGLKNTYAPVADHKTANEAIAYSLALDWEPMTDIYTPNSIGVGNVLSAPTDLVIFDEALLNGKLISDRSLKMMKTFKDEGTGTGIFRVHFKDHYAYGHEGDTFGSHAFVYYSPDDKLTVAYCINGEVYSHDDIGIAIVKMCYGGAYNIPSFKTFAVSKEALNKYAGNYSNAAIPLKVIITRHDSILLFQQAGIATRQRLDALTANVFELMAKKVQIEFDVPKNELILKQDGESYILKKE